MLARDVRVLRQRRRLAEEEAAGAWRAVEQAIQNRQQTELRVEELKLKHRIADATKPELDEVRGGRRGAVRLTDWLTDPLPNSPPQVRAKLYEQVAAATQQCDNLAAQLEERQTKLSGSRPSADGDPEEEMKRKMSFGNKLASRVARDPHLLTCTHGTKASRALSFKSKKSREAAAAGSGGGEGEKAPELKKGGSSSGLKRSMSFKRATGGEGGAPPTAAGEAPPELKKGGSSGGLLRSLSFKRAASAEPGALKKSTSESVAKATGGEGRAASASPSAAAGEVAPELKKGTSSGGLLRSLSFKRGAPTELKKSASEGVPKDPATVPTQEPKKAGAGGLIRKMSFSRQKAEAKAFVQTQKQPADGTAGEAAEKPPPSAPSATPSGLVRKLSFGRKKTETP
eukprot:scaffold59916_cov59-Phaeocystis_antarctica.AAC.1